MGYDLAYHVNRIERWRPELRKLVNDLRGKIASLGNVTESFHRDCIRYKAAGDKFCELHPKPRNGYVWIHVRSGDYPNLEHTFEDTDYLSSQRRMRIRSKTEIPIAMKVIRHSSALAQ